MGAEQDPDAQHVRAETTDGLAPPLHVGRPHTRARDSFIKRAGDMFDRQWFTNDGPLVRELEARLAEHLGVRHCVAMCNGTLALEITIRALGLSGEVIVPSYTFVATAHALYWQGVTPVFADIDPVTHTLDADAVRQMITPRTTGIIGVHLWGRPADTKGLQAVADEHNLQLIYDAAHAFDCTHLGRPIGGFGRAEVFSFHATKFFSTFEGGAVTTDDDELAEAMRLMRNFGFSGYDNVIHPGTNGKLTEVCAAMGLSNLEHLSDLVQVNIRNHRAYVEGLAATPGVRVLSFDGDERHNHQYAVLELGEERAPQRDSLVATLHANNVLARKYFWPGVHRMEPYRRLFPHAGLMLPVTKNVAERVVVLPNGPTVSTQDIARVSSIISAHLCG